MDDYEYLKQFAVGKQLEYIEAIIACGGNKTAASKMVGTNHRSNLRALETVKYKSASKNNNTWRCGYRTNGRRLQRQRNVKGFMMRLAT